MFLVALLALGLALRTPMLLAVSLVLLAAELPLAMLVRGRHAAHHQRGLGATVLPERA